MCLSITPHLRCNISYLEEWLREKDLQGSNAMETLGPLSQVAWLLQVNKTADEDAAEIKQRCSELSSVQVQTLRCDDIEQLLVYSVKKSPFFAT